MPSIVGHFVAGASIALPFSTGDAVTSRTRPGGLILAAGLLAAAPDLDAVLRGVIPYDHFFGHRGFFHSPAFALLLSVALSSIIFAVARSITAVAWLALSFVWFLSTASHGILDSMTDGGLGVMLLYPASERRLFLPWTPFYAPPLGTAGLSERAIQLTVKSELPFLAGCVVTGTLLRLAFRLLRSGRRVRNAPGNQSPREPA